MALLTNVGRELGHRLEEVDAQVDKIERLIEGASRIDTEIAAGMASTEPLTTVQKKVIAFEAASESLARDIKAAQSSLGNLL